MVMNSHPQSPRTNANTPSRDRTPSSNGVPVKTYTKPIRTTGERLASLVGASITNVGDTIYVFGGFDQYTDEIYNKLNKLDYNKDECQWKQVIYLKGDPPAKRTDHTATLWNDDKLIIFGGSSEEEDIYLNDVVVLDLATMSWSHPEVQGFIPEGRIRHSATIYGNKLYIAGGGIRRTAVTEFADTLLVLDLDTWEWKQPIPFVKRVQHMSFIYSSRLYLFGGLREDMSRSNHLAFIDLIKPEDVTQLDISSPAAPSLGQRFAQICGDQLIVLVTLPFREALMEAPVTGLWTLDLPSMQWHCKELGTRYESCSWHCFSMAEHSTSFYLFGTTDDDPDEFYGMVLKVELEELGIVPVPPPQLGKDLISLLLNQQLQQGTDFSICSSTEPEASPIHVHRIVLLARWPYFEHLMNSGMAESVSNILTMEEPIFTIGCFVRYLYTDTLDDPSFTTETIADMMVMAHKYMLRRLLALCTRHLFKKMDNESVSKIYHAASLSEQRGLQQACLHFIFQNFGAVVQTDTFRQLPQSTLSQIWNDTPINAAIVYRPYVLSNGSIVQDDIEEDDEDMFE